MGSIRQAGEGAPQGAVPARIAEAFRDEDPADAEQVAEAVFVLLSERVTAGEIQDVKHVLPEEIRDPWPRTP